MPERAPPPDAALASLEELARWTADLRAPPVERWDPVHCGDSGIVIARDGRWLHHGVPIGRPEMVRLFASVLRREAEGSFVLVTPAEKLGVTVEDLPFAACALRSEGEGKARRIALILTTGEAVVADREHPLAIDETGRPAIRVRASLAARILRPVWYELAALAIEEGAAPLGLWSDGVFFPLDAGS